MRNKWMSAREKETFDLALEKIEWKTQLGPERLSAACTQRISD